ncbi:MAG TPA: transglycosylase SLT domain-containing protein [Candidatus Binatia bacterium]|nr:transglycosylase SLT domain-containing protein [Candidatus Binatia bacterium]
MRAWVGRVAVGIAAALIATSTFSQAEFAAPASRSDQSPFTVPPGLRSQVEFWKKIFATYSIHQVVIHDALHLDRVYEVVDFRPLAAAGMSDVEIDAAKYRTVERETAKVRAILLRLDQIGADSLDPSTLSEDERKILAVFQRVKQRPDFRAAAAPDRLRTQSGLKERFARGVEVGARYWPEIERIFREYNVPLELTRLPLVESCFNVRAYSKVGAAGVWQFMPATGRRFMHIDHAVDERRDPVVAARAAAQYLKADYEALGTWPLAITAYNHGRAGMAHAVATVGSTNITDIVRRYHGAAFKFASRNFYAEFLAAIAVEREAARHFGDLNYERPVAATNVRIADFVKLSTLATCAGTSVDALADLNPALTPDTIAGKLSVPRGYTLRIPEDSRDRFQQRYAALDPQHKRNDQPRTYVVHRVKRGQTLVAIARQYGTTVSAIQKRNNLKGRKALRAGQALEIPRG